LRGKALANGHGYVTINHPDKMPETTYPPGYPFIISLVIKATGNDIETAFTWAKILNGFMFVCTLLFCYLLFRRVNNNVALSLSITALLAINPVLLKSATIMMTEIPYLFALMSAFYFLSKTDLSMSIFRDKWLLLSILFLIFGYYIRTQGMSAFFGVMVYFAVNKKWKHIFITITVFILQALPWYIWGKIYGAYSYIQALLMVDPYDPEKGTVGALDLVSRFFHNLWSYFTIEVPAACLPSLRMILDESNVAQIILFCVFSILISLGIYKTKKYRSLLSGYLIGVFGIILFWPSVWTGPRFLSSCIPILVLFCITGLWSIILSLRDKLAPSLTISPYILLALGLLFLKHIQSMHTITQLDYPANWKNYFKMADWLKNNTPSHSVICCRKPGFFHLFSDRLTKRYPLSRVQKDILQDFTKYDVDYVVLEQLGFGSTNRYLVPVIKENFEIFEEVRYLKDPSTYLFKIFSGKTPLGRARLASMPYRKKAAQARLQGNIKEAIENYLKISNLFKSSKIDDLIAGYAYNDLGDCYFAENKFNSAEIYYTKAIENFKRHLGKNHRKVGVALTNLGKTLLKQVKFEEAENILLEALDVLAGISNTGDPDVGRCLHYLGGLYYSRKMIKKAEIYCKKAIDIWNKLPIEYFAFIKSDVQILYAIYIESGRHQEASRVFQSLVNHIKKTFGINSDKILSELDFGPGK
jgi:hypothetical protein